jgi:hypothetical protein
VEGRVAARHFFGYLNERLETVNPSSPDGRILYNRRLERGIVQRELVFLGARSNRSPSREVVAILKAAVSGFAGLADKFGIVEAAISMGSFFCGMEVAMALFYLVEMDRAAQKVEPGLLGMIPDLFRGERAPYAAFQGKTLANVDIVVRNFAKQLRKCGQGQIAATGALASDFVFAVDLRNGVAISEGSASPIGIARP